jgi:hypothetical protein
MPKFRVTVNYSIAMTEIHDIEVDDPEQLEEFRDGQYWDFTSEDTLVEKVEGDCLDNSLNYHVEEINVLDQIVEAIDE